MLEKQRKRTGRFLVQERINIFQNINAKTAASHKRALHRCLATQHAGYAKVWRWRHEIRFTFESGEGKRRRRESVLQAKDLFESQKTTKHLANYRIINFKENGASTIPCYWWEVLLVIVVEVWWWEESFKAHWEALNAPYLVCVRKKHPSYTL